MLLFRDVYVFDSAEPISAFFFLMRQIWLGNQFWCPGLLSHSQRQECVTAFSLSLVPPDPACWGQTALFYAPLGPRASLPNLMKLHHSHQNKRCCPIAFHCYLACGGICNNALHRLLSNDDRFFFIKSGCIPPPPYTSVLAKAWCVSHTPTLGGSS